MSADKKPTARKTWAQAIGERTDYYTVPLMLLGDDPDGEQSLGNSSGVLIQLGQGRKFCCLQDM